MQCIECNHDIFCIHIAIAARRNLAIFVSINPLYRAVNYGVMLRLQMDLSHAMVEELFVA